MLNRREFIKFGLLTLASADNNPMRWRVPERLSKILAQLPKNLREPVRFPQRFRLQILWSSHTAQGWHHEAYRLGAEWSAPASMVKVPVAILALRKLRRLGLPRSTQLRVLNPAGCASQASETAEFEAIELSLRRMLIVSDNGAYNRLWEFVGADAMARDLPRFGFPQARLQARLGACSPADNALGRGYELADQNGKLLRTDRTQRRLRVQAPSPSPQVGNAYYDAEQQLRHQAKDFGASNHWSLGYAHALTLGLAGAAPAPLVAQLSADDRAFLTETLATLPRNCIEPKFSEVDYPDHWGKFLVFGDRDGRFPEDLQIVNKIGEAYGFLSDSAWIRQGRNACVLSATLYVNSDGILNDDKYEYEQLGRPFLAELGRRVLAASPLPS